MNSESIDQHCGSQSLGAKWTTAKASWASSLYSICDFSERAAWGPGSLQESSGVHESTLHQAQVPEASDPRHRPVHPRQVQHAAAYQSSGETSESYNTFDLNSIVVLLWNIFKAFISGVMLLLYSSLPTAKGCKNFFFIATLQRKSHLCIPRKEIARPQSQFQHLCVCERFFIFN